MADFKLNCWILGDPRQNVFSVKISRTENVIELKELVKQKMDSVVHSFPPYTLTLWQVSIPAVTFREEVCRVQSLEEVEGAVELEPLQEMGSDVFRESDPARQHIHVIVVRPANAIPQTPHTPSQPHTLYQISQRYRRLVEVSREKPTPSTQAKSAGYAKLQETMDPIYDGRCAKNHRQDTLALPAMFYHPAFAHFLDYINDPDFEVPEDKIAASTDFITASSVIYDAEDKQRDTFLPYLNKAIGHTFFTLSNSDKTQPDGLVPLNISASDDPHEPSLELVRDAIALVLREDKNEIGTGRSDPSIQGVLSARRFWALSQRDGIRNATCCPTFVLATAGPHIMVMALVMTDKVIVQRLTDFVYVGRVVDGADSHCLRVARIFHALDRCISLLADYYTGISPMLDGPDSEHPRFFPSITVYPESSFRYIRALEEDSSCVTFLVQDPSRQLKVVKFVQRYGFQAHDHLAKAGFAPEIFYYGPVARNPAPSYNQYFMVVMEYVQGKSAAVLKLEGKLPHNFVQQVREVVDYLHEINQVFGDLRHQNIMVSLDGNIKFVDFDWAGVHDQAKYPAHMNMENITWPQGVGPRRVMLMAHDNEMLSNF